jgi:hypothetical protein
VGELLADGVLPALPRGLEDDPEAGLPVEPPVRRIDAQNAYLTPGAVAVALKNLHRGRLARAVRAEQGKGLAVRDVQVDAVDGGQAAVFLAEAAHADRRLGRIRSHTPSMTPHRP